MNISRADKLDRDEDLKDNDRVLPIANVTRIMKSVLPENSKISKDAKECIQECASEFIAFIASEAGDRCLNEKRKTVTGEDILWAMQSLGFDQYNEVMGVYLFKYREALRLMADKLPTDTPEIDTSQGLPTAEATANDIKREEEQQQQQHQQES